MTTRGFILLVAGVLVVAGVILVIRSHRRWLAQQSPVGVWITSTPIGRVILQFDGGRDEGAYTQVTEVGNERTREWGHWSHDSGQLQLLIMATDVKDHPRFGVDTAYRVTYVAPNSIRIDGPDRAALLYERAGAWASLSLD